MDMVRAYFKETRWRPRKRCFTVEPQGERMIRIPIRDMEKIGKQRIRTSRQNLVWSTKNCDREEGMEHTRSCPKFQIGVKGEIE